MAGFAIERNRAGTVHGLQILLNLKAGRAFLFDDGHGAVALCAEDFHGGGVEHGSVRSASERKRGQDLAVFGAEDHHGGLWSGRVRAGAAARGEEDLIFGVDGEAVAATFIDE